MKRTLAIMLTLLMAAAVFTSCQHKKPTVLLILDGFGLSEQSEHNAIALADTPVLDRLRKDRHGGRPLLCHGQG